ncbi:MinD/ParA family protein [Thermoanaerobacteraceae bacterium SP2]|jgi:flagellar biosynthesis protein FlhG|nr:MinD/ParA family protein [Thermoanaerobacteraceae bacterium SP2]
MYEQASKLKKIMDEKYHREASQGTLKVYCVTSGKGGVGKTNLSINLSLVLQELGKRVLLVDADLGLANVDVIAGLYPKYNISHILSREKTINEIILEGPMGIKILPGASGLYEMANLSIMELNFLIKAFNSISQDFDIVVIDTGAGISKHVLSFVRSSDEVIIVTTPEPSAITDAYAVIKLIYKYSQKIHVIINRVDNFRDAEFTVQKISNASRKFLHTDIDYLGYVLEDRSVFKSNMEQIPFYTRFPESLASKCIANLGRKLLYGEQKPVQYNYTFESWVKKLMAFLRN